MKRRLKIICLLVMMFQVKSYCQKTPDWIYNYIYKNIVTKSIIIKMDRESLRKTHPEYLWILPDVNCTFDMTYKKIPDSVYPNKNFVLFECLFDPNKQICKDYILERSFADGNPSDHEIKKIIVAVDSIKEEIKFISGEAVILSEIEGDFNNFKTEEDIDLYLKFRLIEYELSNIKKTFSNKKRIKYTAFSSYYSKNIEISFDREKKYYTIR